MKKYFLVIKNSTTNKIFKDIQTVVYIVVPNGGKMVAYAKASNTAFKTSKLSWKYGHIKSTYCVSCRMQI